MYKKNLMLVVKYLKGELDIYNGKYEDVINTWNDAWDEMKYLGYNPEKVQDVKKYIRDEL